MCILRLEGRRRRRFHPRSLPYCGKRPGAVLQIATAMLVTCIAPDFAEDFGLAQIGDRLGEVEIVARVF